MKHEANNMTDAHEDDYLRLIQVTTLYNILLLNEDELLTEVQKLIIIISGWIAPVHF